MGLISWIRNKMRERKERKEKALKALLDAQKKELESRMYTRRSSVPTYSTKSTPPSERPIYNQNPISARQPLRSWNDNDSSIHDNYVDTPSHSSGSDHSSHSFSGFGGGDSGGAGASGGWDSGSSDSGGSSGGDSGGGDGGGGGD